MKVKIILLSICIIFSTIFVGCNKNVSMDDPKNDTVKENNLESENNKNFGVVGQVIEDKSESKGNTIEDSKIDKDKVEESKVDNNSVEKNRKTIVIDPGHSSRANLNKEANSPGSNELKIKDGGGAEGVVSKTPEYIINMKISLKLKKLLEEKGFNVIMTKTSHEENLGNIERAEVGNSNNADLVIRVHADSSDSGSVNGASMLVPAPVGYAKDISSISRNYGTVILEALIKEAGMKNKGVIEREDLTGFNWSKVPVILVEVGFLSNPSEDKLLNTDEYQEKISSGLSNGIDKAFSN